MPPEAPRPPLTTLEMVERIAAVGLIAMMSNALLGPLFDPTELGGDKVPFLRLVWLPVYAAVLGLSVLRFQQMARFWLPAAALFALVAWAFASKEWSIDPGTTQRRAIALFATTLLGVYLAARHDGKTLAELCATTFLVLAVGSYAAAILYPTMGVHQTVNAGLWRGLWYEKNAMGMMMVYGSLAAAAAAITNPRRAPLWLFAMLLFVGLIVMTRSATSLLTLGIVLAGAATLWLMRRGPASTIALLWLGVTAAGSLAGAYLLIPEVLFKALGKDPTLTGRTDIWNAVLAAHEQSPMLGYGYAAFWGLDSPPAMWMREKLQWPVPSAHNGWLDILVQLGLVGTVAFGVILVCALAAAVVRHQKVADGYFATVFLVVYLFQTMSESIILVQNSLPWVFAVAAICRMLGPLPAGATLQGRTPEAPAWFAYRPGTPAVVG